MKLALIDFEDTLIVQASNLATENYTGGLERIATLVAQPVVARLAGSPVHGTATSDSTSSPHYMEMSMALVAIASATFLFACMFVCWIAACVRAPSQPRRPSVAVPTLQGLRGQSLEASTPLMGESALMAKKEGKPLGAARSEGKDSFKRSNEHHRPAIGARMERRPSLSARQDRPGSSVMAPAAAASSGACAAEHQPEHDQRPRFGSPDRRPSLSARGTKHLERRATATPRSAAAAAAAAAAASAAAASGAPAASSDRRPSLSARGSRRPSATPRSAAAAAAAAAAASAAASPGAPAASPDRRLTTHGFSHGSITPVDAPAVVNAGAAGSSSSFDDGNDQLQHGQAQDYQS